MATRRPKKTTTAKKVVSPRKKTSKTVPAKNKVKSVKPTSTKKPATPKKKVATPNKTTTTKKKPVVRKKVVNKITTIKEPPKIRLKRRMYEYEKLAMNAHSSKFHDMGQRVQRGEVKWAYYTTEEGDVGYHYYVKLKNK